MKGVDRLLTPPEVAEMFRVDTATVNRWAVAGLIPNILTPGRRRRFPETKVKVLLAAWNGDNTIRPIR